MSQLTNIPKQSYFSAQLEVPIDGTQTTGIILSAVPSYTPSGETVKFNILDSGGLETISATGWNSGTGELTGVTRALARYTGETAPNVEHGAGVTVVLSDDWTYFEDIQTAVNSKFDTAGGTITGATDFSGASTTFRIPNLTEVQRDALASPANGMLLYNTTSGEFEYYDGGAWQTVGTASVPNASETVAGISELATASESLAGTTTGATGARLVQPTSLNVTTSAGAGDAGKNPVLNASGILDPTILNAQTTSTANAVVRYDSSGDVDVPTTPGGNNKATSKSYVDTQLSNKISLLDVDGTQVVVQNTTTETSLGSFTLNGGLLGASNAVQIKLYVSDFDIDTSSSDDLLIRVKYGATTLITLTISEADVAAVTNMRGFMEVLLFGNGTTSSQKAVLLWDTKIQISSDALDGRAYVVTGTSAEDSTTNLVLDITAQWGAAKTANKIQTEVFVATYLEQ